MLIKKDGRGKFMSACIINFHLSALYRITCIKVINTLIILCICAGVARPVIGAPVVNVTSVLISGISQPRTYNMVGYMSWPSQSFGGEALLEDGVIELNLLVKSGSALFAVPDISGTCSLKKAELIWPTCQPRWFYGTKSFSLTFSIDDTVFKPCITFGSMDSRIKQHITPGANCSSGPTPPPPRLICKLNASSLEMDFSALDARNYNGLQKTARSILNCTKNDRPADASLSVTMTDWNPDLKNGTSAVFTISAGGNTLVQNGDLAKTVNGTLDIDVISQLKGTPVSYGPFSASSVMTINYD